MCGVRWFARAVCSGACILFLLCIIADVARGKPARAGTGGRAEDAPAAAGLADRTNRNTIGIVSATTSGTSLAPDLAAVLEGEDLRILPSIGEGGGQNIRDMRSLKGAELGIPGEAARSLPPLERDRRSIENSVN
jgi:hypothetical protein